jgi:hypothetical protein
MNNRLFVMRETPTPNIFVGSHVSATENIISWTVPIGGFTGVQIHRKVDAGSFSEIATQASSASPQYIDTNASANGTYTYRVRTYRGSTSGTVSDWSNEFSIVVSTQSSSLLTESDFTYAGAFNMPATVNNYTTGYGAVPLTIRNGRLMSCAYNGSGGYRVYEVDIPALTLGSNLSVANTASLWKYWGKVTGTLSATAYGQMILYALFWDDVDSRLYWQDSPYYTGTSAVPTFGYSTLDDGSTTVTPVGVWKVSGVDHKEVKTGVLRIPNSSFIAANCPGKPIAVGFGSGGLSVVSGHSMGPAFRAVPAPDTGTYASGTALPKVELLSYPYNTSALVATNPLRARRDDNYSGNFYGDVVSATSNTFTITSTKVITSGETRLVNRVINITGGTGSGQTRTCTGVSGFQHTVDSPWTTIPDATSTWEAEANANAVWPGPSAGIGYWTLGDVIYQSAVWIKNATKEAIVVFVTFADGAQYYGHNPNGPNYQSGHHEIWLIDPADLAAVAQGTKVNYTVEPYETFHVEFPWFSYPLGSEDIQWAAGKKFVGGVTVTPDHSRIYVGVARGLTGTRPAICAFDVAG